MKLRQTTPAHNPLARDAGFTLLEIIAVIVILGILAVVAVPRYFDLQASARERAVAAGIAEVRGRINGYFAQQVLSGQQPEAIEYTIGNIAPAIGSIPAGNLGDFQITAITEAESVITITLVPTATALSGVTIDPIQIPRPGI